jgi:excinuclease ABC subunit C
VFIDGEADKSKYRLFKVRGEAAGDDFASMFQVLTRRLLRGKEHADLPDLLVVDGGKGQLNVARAALREIGLSTNDVPLAGLAKSKVLEDEERFAARQGYRPAEAWDPTESTDASASPPVEKTGRSRKKGRFVKEEIERSPERVFLPGQKNPVVLRQNTGELFLLARLRDEAHRFAITFHRKLRRERNFRSVLEEIPGIGQKRKRALLSHFGSLKRIRAAGVDEIALVEGFNAQLAQRVRDFLAAQPQQPAEASEVQGADALEAAQLAVEALGERDDVAFDAAAAELEAIEDEPALPDEAQLEEAGRDPDATAAAGAALREGTT